MNSAADFYAQVQQELQSIDAQGLMKRERVLTTPQGALVRTADGRELVNLCANNYLGLSSHPSLIQAAHRALDTHGFGLSSVRFICGTQDIHKELERRIAAFVGCEDAIISDALNHASIIDGIRLCKAQRWRYANSDLADLERCLQEARDKGVRHTLVFSDGVFSMDGSVAQLKEIRQLCDRYGALLGIDECHASGFLGKTGRGTPEHCGVHGQIDIVTGTFGKALGGASGGFTAARKEVVELLRQRSRPYLFSNTLAPSIVGASLAALDLLEGSTALRDKLEDNTRFWRAGLTQAGFDIKPGKHPIVPVMVYDAVKAQQLSQRLLELGVYAVGFFFPVVPKGQARIRTQMSAALERSHLERALAAFVQAGRELELIK